MTSNTAAWITAPKATPFEIKEAPMGVPGENQVLIKNHAIAVNPIDGKLQALAMFPLNYPDVLGQDVAGEIVQVGPNVTRFKKGDRVLGVALGFVNGQRQEKAFQTYTVLHDTFISKLPDKMPYEKAAVLPLGVTTAASALFHPGWLNLQVPTDPKRPSTGQVVLVWGGASSVGSNAIQQAVAAGYEVVTTASPKNFYRVKKLGASHAFDYKSPSVIADLVAAVGDKSIVGAVDAVGSLQECLEFVQQCKGTKFVATVAVGELNPPEGVGAKGIFAPAIKDTHVVKAIFKDFLPQALVSGSYVPAPEPLVVGRGLENVQGAVDLVNKGVSASKAVVSL